MGHKLPPEATLTCTLEPRLLFCPARWVVPGVLSCINSYKACRIELAGESEVGPKEP